MKPRFTTVFPRLLFVSRYIPKNFHFLSGRRYCLETFHSAFWTLLLSVLCRSTLHLKLVCCNQVIKKAVVSLFTFASLTDGRTVWDLPKQHREKRELTKRSGSTSRGEEKPETASIAPHLELAHRKRSCT